MGIPPPTLKGSPRGITWHLCQYPTKTWCKVGNQQIWVPLSPSPCKNYSFLSPLVDYELLEGGDHFLLSLYSLSIWHIKYVQYIFTGWIKGQLAPQCEEILFPQAQTNPGPQTGFLQIGVVWSQVGEWAMTSINTTLEKHLRESVTPAERE